MDGQTIAERWNYANGSEYFTMRYVFDQNGSVIGFCTHYPGFPEGYFEHYLFAKNLQGDVTAMYTVGSGLTLIATYEYDSWGKVLSVKDANGTEITNPSHLAMRQPFRYRGYHYDVETGFYYLQSRYYDPQIGRFINADSYASTGQGFLGHNMFAYCGNNPIMGYDPTGELDWGKLFGGASLMGVGITACAAAATVVTGGACAPLLVAATATFAAGGITVLNGAAEMIESTTGYNFMRDGAYGGNTKFYEKQKSAFSKISAAGTIALTAINTMNSCFIAGTLVLSADGAVAIEEIKPGDYVWAWDEETGDIALKRVVEAYVNEANELVHVFVNGAEIVATPAHPFYSPVKGWTDAVHLRAGDILVLVNGEYVVVEKVQHELLESPVKVYNFQVEDYHTYYVAGIGILVHNICDEKITGYTKHGLIQATMRDGAGVSPAAILETVRNPKKIIEQADGALKYISNRAVVVINEIGKIITTYARGHGNTRGTH